MSALHQFSDQTHWLERLVVCTAFQTLGRTDPLNELFGIILKLAGNLILVLTTLVSITALAISVYPGVLNDLLFLGFLLSLLIAPVGGIIVAVVLVVLACKGKLRGIRFPWKQVAIIAAILFGTCVMLIFYVPRRIAFAMSKASFEQLVPQAPLSEHDATSLGRRIGIYEVDKYATDPRGGVYFRVYSGGDGIGPDQISYGFTYEPNQAGTPFGAARYRVFGLGEGWYWFRASNDWH